MASAALHTAVENEVQNLVQILNTSGRKDYGADVGSLQAEDHELATAGAAAAAGSRDGQVEIGKMTVQSLLKDAQKTTAQDNTEKADSLRLMDLYKKGFKGNEKDKARLEKEQRDSIQNTIDEGRRRHLLLVALHIPGLMHERKTKQKDATDYVPLLKMVVAAYFFPEKFRAKPFMSDAERINNSWMHHLNVLVHHVLMASPFINTREEVIRIETENAAFELPKEEHEEALKEISAQVNRAKDEGVQDEERWGKTWIQQVDMLQATTAHTTPISPRHRSGPSKIPTPGSGPSRIPTPGAGPSKIPTPGSHGPSKIPAVGAAAAAKRTSIGEVRPVLEWEEFRNSDWNNVKDAEKAAILKTAREFILVGKKSNWEKIAQTTMDKIEKSHGLNFIEAIMKTIACISKVDVKAAGPKFNPEIAAVLVYIHRYLQMRKGVKLPQWCKKGVEEIPKKLANVVVALKKDLKAFLTASVRAEKGITVVNKLAKTVADNQDANYREFVMMALAWPDKDKLGNRYIYDSMMRLHEAILKKG